VLALTDIGITHLFAAAREISPRKRRRFLEDFAAKLDPPSNEKRRASVRRAVARHKARSRAGIAVARVPYDGGALANLALAGWLPPREGYSEAEISAAIAALIKARNLPPRC
jgi:hypothetical protein